MLNNPNSHRLIHVETTDSYNHSFLSTELESTQENKYLFQQTSSSFSNLSGTFITGDSSALNYFGKGLINLDRPTQTCHPRDNGLIAKNEIENSSRSINMNEFNDMTSFSTNKYHDLGNNHVGVPSFSSDSHSTLCSPTVNADQQRTNSDSTTLSLTLSPISSFLSGTNLPFPNNSDEIAFSVTDLQKYLRFVRLRPVVTPLIQHKNIETSELKCTTQMATRNLLSILKSNTNYVPSSYRYSRHTPLTHDGSMDSIAGNKVDRYKKKTHGLHLKKKLGLRLNHMSWHHSKQPSLDTEKKIADYEKPSTWKSKAITALLHSHGHTKSVTSSLSPSSTVSPEPAESISSRNTVSSFKSSVERVSHLFHHHHHHHRQNPSCDSISISPRQSIEISTKNSSNADSRHFSSSYHIFSTSHKCASDSTSVANESPAIQSENSNPVKSQSQASSFSKLKDHPASKHSLLGVIPPSTKENSKHLYHNIPNDYSRPRQKTTNDDVSLNSQLKSDLSIASQSSLNPLIKQTSSSSTSTNSPSIYKRYSRNRHSTDAVANPENSFNEDVIDKTNQISYFKESQGSASCLTNEVTNIKRFDLNHKKSQSDISSIKSGRSATSTSDFKKFKLFFGTNTETIKESHIINDHNDDDNTYDCDGSLLLERSPLTCSHNSDNKDEIVEALSDCLKDVTLPPAQTLDFIPGLDVIQSNHPIVRIQGQLVIETTGHENCKHFIDKAKTKHGHKHRHHHHHRAHSDLSKSGNTTHSESHHGLHHHHHKRHHQKHHGRNHNESKPKKSIFMGHSENTFNPYNSAKLTDIHYRYHNHSTFRKSRHSNHIRSVLTSSRDLSSSLPVKKAHKRCLMNLNSMYHFPDIIIDPQFPHSYLDIETVVKEVFGGSWHEFMETSFRVVAIPFLQKKNGGNESINGIANNKMDSTEEVDTNNERKENANKPQVHSDYESLEAELMIELRLVPQESDPLAKTENFKQSFSSLPQPVVSSSRSFSETSSNSFVLFDSKAEKSDYTNEHWSQQNRVGDHNNNKLSDSDLQKRISIDTGIYNADEFGQNNIELGNDSEHDNATKNSSIDGPQRKGRNFEDTIQLKDIAPYRCILGQDWLTALANEFDKKGVDSGYNPNGSVHESNSSTDDTCYNFQSNGSLESVNSGIAQKVEMKPTSTQPESTNFANRAVKMLNIEEETIKNIVNLNDDKNKMFKHNDHSGIFQEIKNYNHSTKSSSRSSTYSTSNPESESDSSSDSDSSSSSGSDTDTNSNFGRESSTDSESDT